MIQYAIFDLDGTLVQTMDSLMKTGNLTLNKFGFPAADLEKYKKFVGYGAKNLVKSLLINAGDDEATLLEEAYPIYMELFDQYCTYQIKPYPGIEELLQEMQKREIKLAVLTNKPHPMAQEVMARCFPEDTFEIIQGQSDAFPVKPDPAAALYVAQRMGADDLRKVIFMGDSDADMQTARNAGMIAVGASWGFRPAQELLDNGCEILLRDPLDLLPYLE